jgi:hypothetical protein
LDALIDGAEVLGEDTVFFAAEGDEVIDEFGEGGGIFGVFFGGGGEVDGGLAELAEFEIEIGKNARVAGVGQSGKEGGGLVGFLVHKQMGRGCG